jgi:metal-responsive CopG/Arc/MetJ family transcriptional regulator
MSVSSGKQRISITVDALLLQQIDQLSDNRSAVVEEALRLWHRHYLEHQLQSFYLQQSSHSRQFDQDWADFAHSQLEELLDSEGP